MISSIEVLQAGRVRRSKLYYLRQLKGKAARIRRAEQPAETAAEPVEKS
jgi:large subunit ribosomal protein L19